MANNHNLESSHQAHREVQHGGHDQVPSHARHEATHHLTHQQTDHKNLSKLPTNKAAESATPKMELHDSTKAPAADAPKAPAGDAPKAPAAGDAPKKEPLTAERMVAQDMVTDLKNKNMEGQLSKMTSDELGVLGDQAAKKGGQEGLKQFGDRMGKEFDKAQDEAGVKPEWQKKFEFGNNTGKWQDYSISKGNVADTAGFSY